MSQLILGVGGTGKAVILFYRRLTRLLGGAQRALIFDMPFGEEPIDLELEREGVGPDAFLEFLPLNRDLASTLTFSDYIGFQKNPHLRLAAEVLYTKAQLDTELARGMNCEPVVGASAATKKLILKDDAHVKRLAAAVDAADEVILTGSITGGTGSGGIPVLASWLGARERPKPTYGLLYLPWLDLPESQGAPGPSNDLMRRNVRAVLTYLLQRDHFLSPDSSLPSPFKNFVLIGPERDEDRTKAGGKTSFLVNPLHMVGALYILKFESFKKVRPTGEDQGPQFLEIHADRLGPEAIRSGNLTLKTAVMRSRLRTSLLRQLSRQHPDQALSVLTFFPASLAWPALVETLQRVVLRSASWRRVGQVWRAIRTALEKAATDEEKRIEALESLTKMPGAERIFRIPWDDLRKDADAHLGRAMNRLHKDMDSFDPGAGKSENDAVEFIAVRIVDRISATLEDSIRDSPAEAG